MAITKRLIKGSPLTAAEMDANLTILEQTSGSFTALMTGSFLAVSQSVSNLSTLQGTLSGQFTGSAIISGSNASLIVSGSTKLDSGSLQKLGSSKVLVVDPISGQVGWNTVGGVAQDGTDGTSGTSGKDGTLFGSSGTSGKDGSNGTSGTNGTGGSSGSSGSSGKDGSSGVNGTSGTSGKDGTFFGSNGTSGKDGTTGTSGTSPVVTGVSTDNINLSTLTPGTSFVISPSLSVVVGTTLIISLNTSNYLLGQVTQLNPFGPNTIRITATKVVGTASGNGPWNIGIAGQDGATGTSGASGSSGSSGKDGTNGTSGTSIALSVLDTAGPTAVNGVTTITFTGGVSIANSPGNGHITVTVSGGGGTGGSNGTSGKDGQSGTSGVNGSSGSSGTSGVNGFNGVSGTSGTSGTSGKNGVDGFVGSNGTSGTSGVNGSNGTSGAAGTNGSSGTSGKDGSSGLTGTAGSNGTSGTSGVSGTNGGPGINGSDGTSGTSGTSAAGTSGINGSNGTSGTSGINGSSGSSGVSSLLAVTGSIPNGVVRYETSPIERLVVSNTLTFDGLEMKLTGSLFVSGAVSASGFNIYSTGTPELSSATNLNLTAGNAVVVTQSPIRLTNYTDAQTGSLTPQNGDMIYNSTTHKFMGYANGTWVQLH